MSNIFIFRKKNRIIEYAFITLGYYSNGFLIYQGTCWPEGLSAPMERWLIKEVKSSMGRST